MRAAVDTVYRAESRRVFATLIRLLGDFDLAERSDARRVRVGDGTMAAGWCAGQSVCLAGLGRPIQSD